MVIVGGVWSSLADRARKPCAVWIATGSEGAGGRVANSAFAHVSPPTVAYEMNVKDDYTIERCLDHSIDLNQVSFEEPEPPPAEAPAVEEVVEEPPPQVECGFRPMPYGQTGWPRCS